MHKTLATKLIACLLSALALFLPVVQVFASTYPPDDPGLAYLETDLERQWYLPKTKFLDAWRRTTGDPKLIVALLDTGVDATHQDLSGTDVMEGYDFVSNKAIPKRANSDDNGHGTLVAGVLAGTVNNGLGIAGALWQVRVMPLKVLDSGGEGKSENVSKAIRFAVDNGASVINMSFGGVGFGDDANLADSISYAFKRNVVLVAAAGNDTAAFGANLDNEPVFPICDDNGQNMIIGVTAVDYKDQKPDFANYGRNCVDVSAPGKRILSTIGRDPITRGSLPDRYAYASGTSLAAPLVSAQALLLKALFPGASNRQIRDRIIGTAKNIDVENPTQCGGSCKGMLGAGRIEVFQSLASQIPQEIYPEGSLAEVVDTGKFYEIQSGKKLELTPFVLKQKLRERPLLALTEKQANTLPDGPLALPLEGTLLRSYSAPAVFLAADGKLSPVSFQVFQNRGYRFSDVLLVPEKDMDSWLKGKLLPPKEGTLLRSRLNPTVYFVVGQNLHPVSKEFYQARGLSVFPLEIYTDSDIKAMPKGEPFLL